MLLINQVIGLEVNPTWWESEHATPHYIPLEYLETPVPKMINSLDDWRTPDEVIFTIKSFISIMILVISISNRPTDHLIKTVFFYIRSKKTPSHQELKFTKARA